MSDDDSRISILVDLFVLGTFCLFCLFATLAFGKSPSDRQTRLAKSLCRIMPSRCESPTPEFTGVGSVAVRVPDVTIGTLAPDMPVVGQSFAPGTTVPVCETTCKHFENRMSAILVSQPIAVENYTVTRTVSECGEGCVTITDVYTRK